MASLMLPVGDAGGEAGGEAGGGTLATGVLVCPSATGLLAGGGAASSSWALMGVKRLRHPIRASLVYPIPTPVNTATPIKTRIPPTKQWTKIAQHARKRAQFEKSRIIYRAQRAP